MRRHVVFSLSIVLVTALVVTSQDCNPTECASLLPSSTGSREEICRSANEYIDCQSKVIRACGLDDSILDAARQSLNDNGCNPAGVATLSVISLFLCILISGFLN